MSSCLWIKTVFRQSKLYYSVSLLLFSVSFYYSNSISIFSRHVGTRDFCPSRTVIDKSKPNNIVFPANLIKPIDIVLKRKSKTEQCNGAEQMKLSLILRIFVLFLFTSKTNSKIHCNSLDECFHCTKKISASCHMNR